MAEADRLIARAYDALSDGDSWDDLISSCARLAGGDSGVVYVKSPAAPDGVLVAASGIDLSAAYLAKYLAYYERRSPLIPFFRDSPVGHVRALGEFAYSSAYRNGEYFADWVRPQGWGDMIGGHLLRSRELYSWLAIRRPDARGRYSAREVGLIRKIAPHLARAVRLKAKLEAERAMSPAGRALIDCLSCGVVIVDIAGKVLGVNRVAEHLVRGDAGLRLSHGHIHGERSRGDALLKSAIVGAARGFSSGRNAAADLVISRRDARPLTAHVIPFSAPTTWGRLAPSRAVAAIFLIDPDVETGRRVDVVVAAYGLTPAEGRLLREVCNCRGLIDAARKLNVTEATARTHLQRILSKTETRNQAELVSLVAKSSLS
jgi:DNA-binding CsgD family transcriptional regulator